MKFGEWYVTRKGEERTQLIGSIIVGIIVLIICLVIGHPYIIGAVIVSMWFFFMSWNFLLYNLIKWKFFNKEAEKELHERKVEYKGIYWDGWN